MKYMNISIKMKYGLALVFALSMIMPSLATPLAASAQTQSTDNVNLTDSSLKIVTCDGPAGANPNNGSKYTVCDFNGLMFQIQHLINIAIVLGVVVAIGLFSYAGYLHITGVPDNIKKSYDIFRKVGIGFIIMLSAWFIVYQVIIWLTGSSQFAVLLGK